MKYNKILKCIFNRYKQNISRVSYSFYGKNVFTTSNFTAPRLFWSSLQRTSKICKLSIINFRVIGVYQKLTRCSAHQRFNMSKICRLKFRLCQSDNYTFMISFHPGMVVHMFQFYAERQKDHEFKTILGYTRSLCLEVNTGTDR